jgi:putative solute:sodium symporter small subunit
MGPGLNPTTESGAVAVARGARGDKIRRRQVLPSQPGLALSQPSRKEETGAMADNNDEMHWKRTTNLMLTHLGIWFFFGYVVHMFVVPLNKIVIPILGFPLGFYMAAQGSLIAFVVMLFVFAKQQDRIDREHGVAEDD